MRSAIAEADRTTAHQIAAVLKEVCQNGYTDRVAIWADLTYSERQQFQTLLAPPLIAREFAQRIEEAIGYNYPRRSRGHRERFERCARRGSAYFGGCCVDNRRGRKCRL